MKKIIISLLSIILLTGCTSATTNEYDTKIYSSEKGDVKIPKKAKAIVTDGYCGNLLAVGAPVVGCDLTFTSTAWKEQSENIKDIGQSVEKIASLNPDLIITWNATTYEQMSAIAPTILISYGAFDEKAIVVELGKITGQETQAEKVIKEHEANVERLSNLIKHKEYTYSIVEKLNEDIYAYGNKFGRLGSVLYDEIDIKGTEKAESTILIEKNSFIQLTGETVSDFIGDVLIIATPNAEQTSYSILTGPVFDATSASKNKRIYYVDSTLWYHTDMISIKEQMEVWGEITQQNNL